MKALFIGGTGTISMAITRKLAEDRDVELYLVNRGNRNNDLPDNIKSDRAIPMTSVPSLSVFTAKTEAIR